VGEGKERARFWVFAQLLLRRVPQAVETHAQVGWRGGDKHLELRVKTQHAAPALKVWIRRAASSTWLAQWTRRRAEAPSSTSSSTGAEGGVTSTGTKAGEAAASERR